MSQSTVILPGSVSLSLDEIVFSDLNPRKNFTGIEELADDIRMNGGVHTPITVRPFPYGSSDVITFLLVMGERRCRAAKLAGLTHIPCIIRTDLDDTAHTLLALGENINRTDLTPIEIAAAIRNLMGLNPSWNQETVGKKMGMSQEGVSKYLRLLKMSQYAQDAVSSGLLHVSTAIELCRAMEYPDLMEEGVKKAVSEKWTQDAAAGWARAAVGERRLAEQRAQTSIPSEEPVPPLGVPHPIPLQGKPRMDYSALNKTEDEQEPAKAEPAPGPDAITRPVMKPTSTLYVTVVSPGGKWHVCNTSHERWLPDQQGGGFERITEAMSWAKSWGQEPRLITLFEEGNLDAAWQRMGPKSGLEIPDTATRRIDPLITSCAGDDAQPLSPVVATPDPFAALAGDDEPEPPPIIARLEAMRQNGDFVPSDPDAVIVVPAPKALSTLPTDIEDWLSEESLTPEQAIRQLMRLKEYPVSPLSRRLVDKAIKLLPDDAPGRTRGAFIDGAIGLRAAQVGVEVEDF